ncbi:hypothetical protein [Mucilaginibacter sp.]|jgi:hypothetical protein|uniref:hypothetical protein n=1 Tax=Mucilaginibacter sp. TaxID=1882438 RepID=UPI002BB899F2|nr:hypothetical protein [Mucilaginibacter sp.]HTI59468.1 hypothetical protein [Mucilaginibacter sp.]
MLNTTTIKIKTERGEREIFISPFLLQSKTHPDFKSGTFTLHKVYFYSELDDNDYKKNLKQEFPEYLNSDKYIINYGQDFEKYYLGSFFVDFETKHCWDWQGKLDGLNDAEVKALGESLFDEKSIGRTIILFTPTRPSDFDLGKLHYPI